VAGLVAQVAEDGAVRLAQLGAAPLAAGGVGLGQVEDDHAVGVTGRHALALAGEEVEGDGALAIART
jgi:hypothetical protein